MNMKKIAALLLSLLTLSLVLMGCGGDTNKNVEIDVAALADKLSTDVVFKDKMDAIDKAMALSIYNMTDAQVADCKIYASSGATAEEVAVFKAADGKAADVEKSVNTHIEAKRKDFENYVPGELTKLKKPTIYTAGDYVVLCVSDDDAASLKIIKDFVK